MVSTHLNHTTEKNTILGSWELLDKWDADPDTLIWINIDEEITKSISDTLEK